jgi:transcriptional regulator with XRE-family HTH domain
MPHQVFTLIRQERRRRGISGQALARAVGVSQQTVSLVENGGDTMFSNAVAMADHVGLDVVAVERGAVPLDELRQRVLDLMTSTIRELPATEVEVWEAELRLRRRQLGLEPTVEAVR